MQQNMGLDIWRTQWDEWRLNSDVWVNSVFFSKTYGAPKCTFGRVCFYVSDFIVFFLVSLKLAHYFNRYMMGTHFNRSNYQ